MPVTISQNDLLAILPMIVLTVFGLYLMLHSIFIPKAKQILPYLGLLGILSAIVANSFLIGKDYTAFFEMVRVDHLSVVLNFIFLITAGLSLLMATSYSEQESIEFVEFTPLILFSTMGMMFMGAAESLMIIFLGLETMSIALYVMAGFRRSNQFSLEAALKYFLLGAFATGFLLYGIALIYGVAGSTNLSVIADYFTQNSFDLNLLTLAGLGLLIVGFGFKVALVPFHMWTPDVYEGAPMPVTAYMAIGAKAAGFAALLRVLSIGAFHISVEWTDVLWILAVLTMTVGNIIALVQENIKRMLAYSSIAHAGYILVGIVANNEMTVPAVLFYLIAYLFMNIGAFAVATMVSGKHEKHQKIKEFAGLGYSQPLLGFAMAVCMFSLAGFPPTAGFMGKFYLFSAALNSGYLWLVIIGVINSLISVYYYIGVVIAMYMQEPEKEVKKTFLLPGVGLVILIAIIGTFYLGIFPSAMIGFLR